jgi:hypothetical protein
MDCMTRCVLFLALICSLPALAQTEEPAAAPARAKAAEKAPAQAAAPKLTPEQLVTQFRHDEINLLAVRADARSLLAAALMAVPDIKDPHRPSPHKPPALIERAQDADADDVLVWWASAALECQQTEKACPQPETLQKLESLDPTNAAVWALSLLRAQRAKDAPAARAALTSAAQAQKYDDYFGRLVAIVEDAENILPVGDEIIKASGELASAEGYRLLTAAGVVVHLQPPLEKAIGEACADAAHNEDISVDCVALARKIAVSGSLNAQGFGISQLLALLPAGTELEVARAKQRSHAWHLARIGELAERLAVNPDLTRIYLRELHETGNESAAVLAVLRSENVSLEPPADWKAPAPDAPTEP